MAYLSSTTDHVKRPSRPILRARGHRRTRPDTVLAREFGASIELVWRKYLPREDRVIYTTTRNRFLPHIPDGFGFLPSPDGERVLVWEALYSPQTTEPICTTWRVVRLRRCELTELCEKHGEPEVLPYWVNETQVVLEGKEGRDLFDVSSHEAPRSEPYPHVSSPTGSDFLQRRASLTDYCNQYYVRDKEILASVMDSLNGQMGLTDYHRCLWPMEEPVEFLILRALGIPGLGELHPWWPRVQPQAAVSPDGQKVAVSSAWKHPAPKLLYRKNKSDVLESTGAQLRVFDVVTNTLIWEKKVAFRLRRDRPPWMLTKPPTFPWTVPVIRDLRWSPDSVHLSFTTCDDSEPIVSVMNTTTWKEVIQVPDATNAYILPDP